MCYIRRYSKSSNLCPFTWIQSEDVFSVRQSPDLRRSDASPIRLRSDQVLLQLIHIVHWISIYTLLCTAARNATVDRVDAELLSGRTIVSTWRVQPGSVKSLPADCLLCARRQAIGPMHYLSIPHKNSTVTRALRGAPPCYLRQVNEVKTEWRR